MSKTIISALETQLATTERELQQHTELVYQPSIKFISADAKAWFDEHIAEVHSVDVQSDRITIHPYDPASSSSWYNGIDIVRRSDWRGEKVYFECSSRQPNIDSREDYSDASTYAYLFSLVCQNFKTICDRMEAYWLEEFRKLNAALNEYTEKIYDINRELRKCQDAVIEEERQKYYRTGAKCALTAYADDKRNPETELYEMVTEEHSIRVQYGRSKWDYAYVTAFTVLDYPKAKHGKVTIEYTPTGEKKTRTLVLSKGRYQELVTEAVNWNLTGCAKRVEYIKERIARFNQKAA